MAWYRTGTVAVTAGDTVITGIGTLFATHARVGDGFVGPDGRMYEVTNIASETVLAIFPPYQGTTAAEQEYGIIPVQGYPKQLADRAGAMVDQVGELPTRIDDIDAVLAGLGSAAGADLADLLTKAGNLAGLADKAQSQFNLGVILSLAGQVFNTDNSTITNSSAGHLIRIAPMRLQICFQSTLSPSLRNSSNIGAVWNYPAAFDGRPVVLANMIDNGLSTIKNISMVGGYAVSATQASISALIPGGVFVAADVAQVSFQAFAIGGY